MVECLEQPDYGAESCRKVVNPVWASPCGDWKTFSVDPAVGTFFELGKSEG